jgi:hypothetical protein
MVNVDNRGTGGPRGSNNSLYFIVGALVIAVLIIGYFMYGGDDATTDATGTTAEDTVAPAAGADADADVTVETPAATAPAPAPEPRFGAASRRRFFVA